MSFKSIVPAHWALPSSSCANRARPKPANRLSLMQMAMLVVGLELLAGPGSALAQRPIGVDVSSYQGGSINWTSVKNDGVTFAWAKATEGQTVNDADFVVNENNGKAAGVYMGAYHFAHPELHSPSVEASHFWSIAGPYIKADGLTFMPMLDMEVFSGVVGATSYSEWANDWCADIVADAAAAGVKVKPVVYVSACNGCYFNSSVSQWFSDIADYNGGNIYTGTPWTTCTGCEVWGSGVWHVWQVIDAASISGISGGVDLDGYNGTLAGMQSAMIATSATSAIYYWDPQATSGANPYTGSMTGTWENSEWSTSSGGQATTTGWVNGKAACFGVHTGAGTPAYTVTMNSSHVVAGFFDGPLAPNSCNVTINGSGVITLASGPQALDVHNASDGSLGVLTINNVIAGNGQLVPEDDGQAYLKGVNTYSGGTQLGFQGNDWNGIVNFNNGSSFGSGTITVWSSGGALVVQGTSAITIPNDFNFIWTNAAPNLNLVGNPNGVTFSGDWALGSKPATIGSGISGNLVTISGVISGSGAFIINNPGTLALSGVNTYTGNTTISAGTLTIDGAGSLGSGNYSHTIANSGTFNYSSSASQTLSGVISGAGALNANGPGVLALTGVNTYTGATTVNSGGVVQINADSGLGATSSSLTLKGGTLKNNSSSPAVSSSRTITLSTGGGYFDAGWSLPLTINAKITGSGALQVNQDGGASVVLANTANNYTGNTVIGANGPGYYAAGTLAGLQLGADGVIPNGSGFGNVSISATYNGQLDLNGHTDTVNGLSGDGTVNNSTGSGSLSVGGNNQSCTFSGVIENTGGTLALTKVGTGSLTLSGVNTYTGGTTISAGTLDGNVAGSIPGNVNNSAGVLKLDDASTMASSATLTLASAPASSAVNLNFSGTQTIGALNFGVTSKAQGTWGVTGSGAAHQNAAFTGSGLLNVIGGGTSQTITFANPGTQTYGVAPITLGATASSGLTVTYLVTSGPATVAGNQLTITGTGSVTVQASQTGNDNYNPAPLVSQTFTVSPLPVALSGTRSYDGTATAAAAILTIGNNLDGVNLTLSGSATLADSGQGSQSFSSFAGLSLGGSAAGNYTLTGASGSVTITALPVQLSGTRVYDSSATADYSILSVANAVSPDSVTVASGSGTLAGADAGSQAIASFGSLALGNNGAGNYTLTGAGGSVTITNATTTNNIAASPNPSQPGADVTFTAALGAVAPGAGTPTGTVLFKTNGVALGDAIALDGSGVATLITNSLPHGSNTVSAEYIGAANPLGNTNFLGSTNSVVLVVNTPPTASGTNATITQDQALVLSTATLLSLALDPDGDSLSITSAGPTSTNGGTVTLAGGNVTYQPVTNFVGMDLFSFVVSDPYGASATGTVLVTVSLASVPPPYVVVPPTYDSGSGTFQATFTGLPNHTYTIQTAPSPTGPWSFLKTVTTGPDGLIVVTDSDLPPPPAQYYRVAYP
jgi:autotransporter-associated beta strand protein